MSRKINKDSYQFDDWYHKNKDNFKNSLRTFDLLCKPIFFPSDLIRFGKLKQGYFGPDQNDFIWLVELPPGCQVYHSSRSMVVNNSGFPIPSYKIAESEEYNKNKEAQETMEKMDQSSPNFCLIDPKKYSGCATNTYYASDPDHIKEYLYKGSTGFLNEQINYSYGFDNIFPQPATLTDRQFNNRLASKANEYLRGMLAYETKKPSYLVATPDYFFISNNFIGLHNNLKILKSYSSIVTPGIGSASGISLQSNLIASAAWYSGNEGPTSPQAFNSLTSWFIEPLFENIEILLQYVLNCNQGLQCNLDPTCVGTAYYITYSYLVYLNTTNQENNLNSFKLFLKVIYDQGAIPGADLPPGIDTLPGFRMSAYDEDRPYHSIFRFFFMTHEIRVDEKIVKVDGTLSGYSYNPRFKSHPIVSDGVFRPKVHYDIDKAGLFHSEIILFYAPDVLKKSVGNRYDDAYGINSLGILSDFRKYKSTNRLEWICDEEKCKGVKCCWINFHQGHLFEHSSWTAINAISIATELGIKEKSDIILILAAAALHDIGKAGGCGYENFEWMAYDPHSIPKNTQCRIISTIDKSDVGFSYYDIPNHPERGYSMLYGTKYYEVLDFKPVGNNRFKVREAFKLTFQDWEKYRIQNEINEISWKFIRISTGAHWYLGIAIGDYIKGNDEQKNKIATEYLRKIELYYNSEFLKYNREQLGQAVNITMMVSYADLLGSIYTNLPDLQEYNVYNEYPDYHLGDYENFLQTHPGTTIEDYMAALANINFPNRPTPNSVIFGQNVGNNFKEFRQLCTQILDRFVPNPHNSFLTLENLLYGFDTEGIYTSYWDTSYVPKVLIFDLDETLLHMNWNDKQGDFRSVLIDDVYDFVPDIHKILDLCQILRKKYGVIIAIATRHFLPLRMFQEVNDVNSPLYHEKFDIIISQYTGVLEELVTFCKGWDYWSNEKKINIEEKCFNWTEPCNVVGPNCKKQTFGFSKLFAPPGAPVNWNVGTYDPVQPIYLGVEHKDDNPLIAKGQTFAGKIPHMETILKQSNIILNYRISQRKKVIGHNHVNYSDMILFDDSEKYILPSNSPETLGGDVFTVGVTKKGLTFDLFEKAIAIYTFQNLAK